jgi:hypothetical protein
VSVHSDHFLTLPSGHTITVPDGKDAGEVFYAHAAASLSENLCPWCLTSLPAHRQCFDGRHRPVRWHLCAEGIGYVLLDVLQTPASTCGVCGEPM